MSMFESLYDYGWLIQHDSAIHSHRVTQTWTLQVLQLQRFWMEAVTQVKEIQRGLYFFVYGSCRLMPDLPAERHAAGEGSGLLCVLQNICWTGRLAFLLFWCQSWSESVALMQVFRIRSTSTGKCLQRWDHGYRLIHCLPLNLGQPGWWSGATQ